MAAAFLLLTGCLGGCRAGPPVNSLYRAVAERQIQELEGERARLQREHYRLERSIAEDDAKAVDLRDRSAEAAAEVRRGLLRLDGELRTLRAMEEDFTEARARMEEIRATLEPLRDLETQVAALQGRLTEVAAQRAALDQQVAAVAAELEQARLDTAVKLEGLRQKQAAVQELGAAVEAALKAVEQAVQQSPLPLGPKAAETPKQQPPGEGK